MAARTSEVLTTPTIKLSSGHDMPVIGLGTFLMDPKDIDLSVRTALDCGYRHIDTAFVYRNEEAIGASLKKWFDAGGKRDELFITSKLPIFGNTADDVEVFLKKSLKNLDLQYLDLYLIHVPVGLKKHPNKDDITYDEDGNIALCYDTDLIALWKAMENQVAAGRVRSIGISNFNESQTIRIIKSAKIMPSNLQIELHINDQQKELRKLCNQHNISVTAYSTLGSPDLMKMSNITVPLKNPVVEKIAKSHNKTNAQILLRHGVQSGLIVIPKSKTPSRIKQNFDIFDFSLTQGEMQELNDLDIGHKGRRFNFLFYKRIDKHPEYPFFDKII